MSMRGRYPSCTAWRVSENAPEITACEAITVAIVVSTTSGIVAHAGARWKNGCSAAVGSRRTSAPWPK